MIDVSVIVACYNSDWEKEKRTLCSIINQRNISYEIIIADDGSTVNNKDKIFDFFCMHKEVTHSLLLNERNNGTVSNLLSAIEISKGEYVKFISPGDCLYDSFTLYEWVSYMKKNGISVSFGMPVYYAIENNKINIIKPIAPKSLFYYLKNNYNNARKKYLIYDNTVGATFLSSRDITLHYLKLIENRIKYCEDFAYLLMLFDSVEIGYISRNVIWYEYGSGISSDGNKNHKEKLRNDYIEYLKIILSQRPKSFFEYRLQNMYKVELSGLPIFARRVLKLLCVPEYFVYRFVDKLFPVKIIDDTDVEYFNKIVKER